MLGYHDIYKCHRLLGCLVKVADMEYLVFSPIPTTIPSETTPSPVARPLATSSLDLPPEKVAIHATESFAQAFGTICVGLANLNGP